jgi:hypothetical protein
VVAHLAAAARPLSQLSSPSVQSAAERKKEEMRQKLQEQERKKQAQADLQREQAQREREKAANDAARKPGGGGAVVAGDLSAEAVAQLAAIEQEQAQARLRREQAMQEARRMREEMQAQALAATSQAEKLKQQQEQHGAVLEAQRLRKIAEDAERERRAAEELQRRQEELEREHRERLAQEKEEEQAAAERLKKQKGRARAEAEEKARAERDAIQLQLKIDEEKRRQGSPQAGVVCCECAMAVLTVEDTVVFEERPYHRSCLSCHLCRVPLLEILSHEAHFYCEPHYYATVNGCDHHIGNKTKKHTHIVDNKHPVYS